MNHDLSPLTLCTTWDWTKGLLLVLVIFSENSQDMLPINTVIRLLLEYALTCVL